MGSKGFDSSSPRPFLIIPARAETQPSGPRPGLSRVTASHA